MNIGLLQTENVCIFSISRGYGCLFFFFFFRSNFFSSITKNVSFFSVFVIESSLITRAAYIMHGYSCGKYENKKTLARKMDNITLLDWQSCWCWSPGGVLCKNKCLLCSHLYIESRFNAVLNMFLGSSRNLQLNNIYQDNG